jgi:transposase-like protein
MKGNGTKGREQCSKEFKLEAVKLLVEGRYR